MPRRDGTGPVGMGPMTGRGAGFCTGVAARNYANPFCGRGAGRGYRRMFYASGLPAQARFDSRNTYGAYASEADEKELLKRQAKLLEDRLHDVKNRLADFGDRT